jgi:predicted ATPase with chaperone activity
MIGISDTEFVLTTYLANDRFAKSKPGQIELAAGGVLFLDEVSEMSPSAQAKFLRVLQEREGSRLGGTRVLKANVRIIAATNRDLRKAMERGDFARISSTGCRCSTSVSRRFASAGPTSCCSATHSSRRSRNRSDVRLPA